MVPETTTSKSKMPTARPKLNESLFWDPRGWELTGFSLHYGRTGLSPLLQMTCNNYRCTATILKEPQLDGAIQSVA